MNEVPSVGISFEYNAPNLTSTYVYMNGLICETGNVISKCDNVHQSLATKHEITKMLRLRFKCVVLVEDI